MSSAYLESNLSESARDIHRALASLQEELEAIDYYHQRADQTADPELRDLLQHNRNEETEHAAMLFEWLRRNAPEFDGMMKEYLFAEEKITEIEEKTKEEEAPASSSGSLNLGKLQ